MTALSRPDSRSAAARSGASVGDLGSPRTQVSQLTRAVRCPAVERYARLSEHDRPGRQARQRPQRRPGLRCRAEVSVELTAEGRTASRGRPWDHRDLQEPQRPTFKDASRSVNPWTRSDLTATRCIQPSTATDPGRSSGLIQLPTARQRAWNRYPAERPSPRRTRNKLRPESAKTCARRDI